jgi:integrase
MTHSGLDKSALGLFTVTDHINAPAPRQRPGADTEGMIFDVRKTLRPPRSLRERLEAMMRDLRHESAVAFPALEAYLTRLKAAGRSPKTHYDYTREIARLLRMFPQTPFEEFQPEQIEAVLAEKPERSRHITRSIFNGWFEWGVLMDRMDASPMRKVVKYRTPPERPKPIFDESEIALLEALPSPDGALCTLLLGTGIRKAGARRLQRKHIDLDRQRMVVTEKGRAGGKTRSLWLSPEVCQAVADLDLIERLNPNDYLWSSRPGGRGVVSRAKPISDTAFDRWWRGEAGRNIQGVCQRAGVRVLNTHQTRHTYNNRLKEMGVPLEIQQVQLGHEDIRTTRRYNRTDIEDAAALLAEMWPEKPTTEIRMDSGIEAKWLE